MSPANVTCATFQSQNGMGYGPQTFTQVLYILLNSHFSISNFSPSHISGHHHSLLKSFSTVYPPQSPMHYFCLIKVEQRLVL